MKRHRQLVQMREVVRDLEVDEHARETIGAHDLGELRDGACAGRRVAMSSGTQTPAIAELLASEMKLLTMSKQARPLVDRLLRARAPSPACR